MPAVTPHLPCRAGRPKLNTAVCRHRQQVPSSEAHYTSTIHSTKGAKTTQELWPPKPKELESAAVTTRSCITLGTVFMSIPSSKFCQGARSPRVQSVHGQSGDGAAVAAVGGIPEHGVPRHTQQDQRADREVG